MDIRPPKWLLQLAVASLLVIGAVPVVLGGSSIRSVAGAALIGGALVGGVVLDQRGVISIGSAIGVAVGTVLIAVVAVVGLLAVAVFLMFSPGESGLTYINKTTVSIAVTDQGSRSIIDPCSERTLRWHNSWGGDPSTGTPHAEPLPAGAYSVSAEIFRPAPDGVFRVTEVVTRAGVIQQREGMPDLRSLTCEGVPPGWLSPSPSPK